MPPRLGPFLLALAVIGRPALSATQAPSDLRAASTRLPDITVSLAFGSNLRSDLVVPVAVASVQVPLTRSVLFEGDFLAARTDGRHTRLRRVVEGTEYGSLQPSDCLPPHCTALLEQESAPLSNWPRTIPVVYIRCRGGLHGELPRSWDVAWPAPVWVLSGEIARLRGGILPELVLVMTPVSEWLARWRKRSKRADPTVRPARIPAPQRSDTEALSPASIAIALGMHSIGTRGSGGPR